MNLSINLKCEVCGHVTLLKLQLGWLEGHPIRIYCKHCGILIKGKCSQNPFEGLFNTKFKNAIETEELPNYYLSSSGEFLTYKVCEYDKDNIGKFMISPFIENSRKMDYEMFKYKVTRFLLKTKPNWHKHKRIFELWELGNIEYLEKELKKMLPERLFPANNDLEHLRSIHYLIVLDTDYIKDGNINLLLRSIYMELKQLNRKELEKMINYFKESKQFDCYYEKIFNIIDAFIDKFQFLIPTYGTKFYKNNYVNFEEKGTTTCSFEDIKQFYLDAYEVSGEIIMLLIALNNIKYRGSFNKIAKESKKIKNIDDIKNLPKGKRIEHIDQDEIFFKLTNFKLDNHLRNSIGHNDYKYDGINQQIVYDNNGELRKIYLAEFALTCIDLINSILVFEEILYQVRKVEYILNGDIPIISAEDSKKEQGRNEPCLCGSGLKYKKCCLNN